jgi:hypothetical protein
MRSIALVARRMLFAHTGDTSAGLAAAAGSRCGAASWNWGTSSIDERVFLTCHVCAAVDHRVSMLSPACSCTSDAPARARRGALRDGYYS